MAHSRGFCKASKLTCVAVTIVSPYQRPYLMLYFSVRITLFDRLSGFKLITENFYSVTK
jgi:hypothetical protein